MDKLCRLDFDTLFSSITTLIPHSPIPSCPHSWLPSTNPPYFTWLPYTSFLHHLFLPLPFPSFSTPTFLPLLSPLLLYMPIICPYSCYIAAADDDDFLDFLHDDVFCHQRFLSVSYNDDEHDLSADFTVTSLLLIQPTYLLADWSCCATSFSPRPVTVRSGT